MINQKKIIELLKIAKTCCECAMKHFNSFQRYQYKIKKDNSPLTKADLKVNEIATSGISKLFPKDQIISEENKNNFLSSGLERFWLIDPIDGTKEFINGNENFTVNFGLICFNRPVFGLIAQPHTNFVWYNFNQKSWKIKSSFNIKDSEEVKCSKIDFLNADVIASRSHSNQDLEKIIALLKPNKTLNIGSSLKFCLLAEGHADIYPRNAPTMEWDTAAGHSILKNAGGNVLSENGLELNYNKVDFKNKNFVAFGKTNKILPSFLFSKNIFSNYKKYQNQIDHAVKSLKKNKLICFPTETVYGLGAIGNNKIAIDSIYLAKNRPKNNPIIAHVKNIRDAKKLVKFTKLAKNLSKIFWPGPLTMVLTVNEKCKFSKTISQGSNTLAIRIPSHPVALDLLKKLNKPILAPSANKSGHISPTSAEHVIKDFGSNLKNKDWEIAAILDFGSTEIGLESTVVDCRNKHPIILREGYVTEEMIEFFLKLKTKKITNVRNLLSPGMMYSHYAPKTKLLINQKKYIQGSGVLTFGKEKVFFKNVKEKFNLSETKNLLQASELLYEGLRYLDKFNLKFIQVVPIPNEGIGKAINDRLERAAYE